jgi:hypothetical protein
MSLAWPVAGVAQEPPSLMDLVRQEQARRKTLKGASKVYTDKDVKHAPAGPGSAAAPASSTPAPTASAPSTPSMPSTPSAPPPAAAPDAPAAPPANKSGNDETLWKTRMSQAREELRRNEMFAEALQSRVNGLTGEFVNRDDPYQRAKIGDDRQKAIAELDRVKADIERAKKLIADIEEEARRAGVPPGWIR